MPPEIPDIPVPSSRGRDSFEWLQSQGFTFCSPAIRSGHIGMAMSNPFAYYLRARLSLTRALSYSEALSRGSWFHTHFEMCEEPDAAAHLEILFKRRLEELATSCADLGIVGDRRTAILDRERQDFQVTSGWFDVALDVPMGFERPSLRTLLFHGGVRFLTRECLLVCPAPGHPSVPLVAQPDALLYQPDVKGVWVLDLKTTSDSPSSRLRTCRFELQTQHYCFIAQDLLKRGVIQEKFNLPPETRLLGMVHACVQKPTIELCGKDRAFSIDTTPLKSGPRKGEPRNEKVYYGEPLLANYVRRCREWFLGEGEYAELQEERKKDPAVNMSWTPLSVLGLDNEDDCDYYSMLAVAIRYRNEVPWPNRFPRHVSPLNADEDLLPLYDTEPLQWPEVVKAEGLVMRKRDTVEDPTPCIIESIEWRNK